MVWVKVMVRFGAGIRFVVEVVIRAGGLGYVFGWKKKFGLRFELRLGLGFQFGFDQGLRFELH